MSFAKNVGKNVDKIIIKNLSGKYSQKLLDHAKLSATDTFKTSSKKSFKKQQKQPVCLLVIYILCIYIYIYIYIYIIYMYLYIYIYIIYVYLYIYIYSVIMEYQEINK